MIGREGMPLLKKRFWATERYSPRVRRIAAGRCAVSNGWRARRVGRTQLQGVVGGEKQSLQGWV